MAQFSQMLAYGQASAVRSRSSSRERHGFEHFAVEPLDVAGDGWSGGRPDGDAGSEPPDGLLVGGVQGG